MGYRHWKYETLNSLCNDAADVLDNIAAQADRMKNGIPVNENTMVEVYEMCNYLDMEFSKYFGDYIPQRSTGFQSPETFQ